MNQPKTKTVTILLTRYSDLFSNFLYVISKKGYTHASLSLDENDENFYSFNVKGFTIEKPKKRISRKRKAGSVCIRLQVSEEAHHILETLMKQFVENKTKYTYSKLGVFLCLIRIAHKFENSYFCSQFVAEMLHISNAVSLSKDASLYLPNELIEELKKTPQTPEFSFDLI